MCLFLELYMMAWCIGWFICVIFIFILNKQEYMEAVEFYAGNKIFLNNYINCERSEI